MVVLQDASEISSQDAGMSDGMPSPSHKGRRKKANPNLTRDIIAGLAKTLGALPFEARKHKGRYFERCGGQLGVIRSVGIFQTREAFLMSLRTPEEEIISFPD